MASPTCPNCGNPVPLNQATDVAITFSTVCQHCNSEIRLSKKWRLLVFLELVLVTLFFWRLDTLTSLFQRIDGHPYTTFGLITFVATTIAVLTWQQIKFYDPLRRKYFTPTQSITVRTK